MFRKTRKKEIPWQKFAFSWKGDLQCNLWSSFQWSNSSSRIPCGNAFKIVTDFDKYKHWTRDDSRAQSAKQSCQLAFFTPDSGLTCIKESFRIKTWQTRPRLESSSRAIQNGRSREILFLQNLTEFLRNEALQSSKDGWKRWFTVCSDIFCWGTIKL